MRSTPKEKIEYFLRFYGKDMKDTADALQGNPKVSDLNEATSLLLKAHSLLEEIIQ